MLLRFILENFCSFDEPVQFDMFPNMKRTTFSEHIYQQKVPVLKQAAVYGANGAGKSNLIKGLSFIRNFVIYKDFISKIDLEQYIFKLKDKKSKSLSLLVEFNQNDIYFIYSIEISLNSIEKEALYLSGIGDTEATPIYERKGNLITFNKEPSPEVATAIYKLLKKNPFSSLLSLNKEFPIFNDNRVNIASQWFNKMFDIITINSRIPILIDLMRKDKALIEFTNRLFSKIDLGIDRLKVDTQDFETWINNQHIKAKKEIPDDFLASLKPDEGIVHFENERQIYSIGLENGIRKVYQFMFEQMGENGYKGEMNIRSQSDGTVRLLTLIPAIYDAMEKGKTVAIDEINHCIHPSLIKKLVEYFASSKGTKGQLIFTTHETCLLDQQNIMRPDEIWFAQKKDGATQLYSLNEFKLHNSISIQNGYLEGRYGAVPFIGTLE
ncbi:MAG: ATP-binding protein [Bacteroidaceae bacterium]